MPTWTRQPEHILPSNALDKVAVLEIQLGGDLSRRRVDVAGDVEIGHAANHHARLAVGQVKLLHEPIAGINDAIGVEV